ncbi:hypothetical protein B0H16DRAFT_1718485 [Mycena metata]|uniref:Uncharacterized protein n=1 Tax=Mycena metata TaxID=1033252 RepID=A0AAD7JHA6_9AGAR|nr:hypothetical protein B0H16DRAFT_1718485 [Mycena metata]
MRVKELGNKLSLMRSEIWDRGVNLTQDLARFRVNTEVQTLIETTIEEMQSLLDRAGHLVPHRRHVFLVDPRKTLSNILKGSHTLDELNAGWVALAKRLRLANRYFKKYEKEYNLKDGIMPSSPVSTVNGLYDRDSISTKVPKLLPQFRYPRVEPRTEVTEMMMAMTVTTRAMQDLKILAVDKETAMSGEILPIITLDALLLLPWETTETEAMGAMTVEEVAAYKSYPYVALGAPYGTIVPTLEPKFKVDALPEWDGDHDTAVEYFWTVGQLASLKGWMPQALGFWLPTRLKAGSVIQLWFSTLPTSRQDTMRSHYLEYLNVIRDSFLGKRWLLTVNAEFDQQAFRQMGHEDESPQQFIARRIRSIRLLANSDDDGPLEVFLIMRRAPLPWSTILVLENIGSSEELYEKVNEHYEALIESIRRGHTNSITIHDLASNLRKLGFQQSPKRLTANDGAMTIKQVYQILKKHQRPPPKGRYPFSKNDHVTTKMGRAPPSPCKVCGSVNHWDRECPDWNVYLKKQQRGILLRLLCAVGCEDIGVVFIGSAALTLVEALLSVRGEEPKPEEDDQASLMELNTGLMAIETDIIEKEDIPVTPNITTGNTCSPIRASIMEIEDEYWENEARMPKARFGILEPMLDEEELEQRADQEDEPSEIELEEQNPIPSAEPPPRTMEPLVLQKKRNPRPGESALGVSVLSVRGWVGLLGNKLTDLRLDSCADITLVSEEFHASLLNPPVIREGHRMNLAQLTDQGTTIKGYTELKILIESEHGEILQMEAEAYVVRGMSVPIVLWEDFQLSYEIGVSQNVELGIKITFRGTEHIVEAFTIDRFAGLAHLHHIATGLTTHADRVERAKVHRRAKEKRRRRKQANGVKELTVRANTDYRITPHETRVVGLDRHFVEDKDWLVETNFLATADDSFFSVPKTLISARRPCVPVSNLSDRPRIIHWGEVLGMPVDPESHFDKPQSEEELEELKVKTALFSKLLDMRTKNESQQEADMVAGRAKSTRSGDVPRIRMNFGSGVPPSEENAKRVYTFAAAPEKSQVEMDP